MTALNKFFKENLTYIQKS